MSHRIRAVVMSSLALLLLPAFASAQGRKTRGETEANWDAIAKNGNSGPTISAKDIDGMSPLKALMDKKKDLKLTDDQLGKLKSIDMALKEKNTPLGKMVDSLRKSAKPAGANASAEDQARAVIARESLMAVLKDVNANNEASAKEAMPVLDESQQKMAADVLQKQADDNMEMLRSKLGGRGPGG